MPRFSVLKLFPPLFIILLLFALGLIFRPKCNIFNPFKSTRLEFPPDPDEVYIVSTYYYPTSQSLGDNAIAMVISTNYEILDRTPQFQLLGVSDHENIVRNASLERITPHNFCQWISIFVTAQLVPNMNSLHILSGTRYTELPFKTVSYKKREVVTCISPLFANEQWHNLVLCAHVYKKFGTFMHIYARSVVEPVYKLMLEYEKEDYLKVEPWLRINLSSVPVYEYNPNVNVEFRNQAAAQTDCLLQYKESADFISFLDLDDLLIPRLADTFAAEFEMLFNIDRFKEENSQLKKVEQISMHSEDADPLLKPLQNYEPEKYSFNRIFSSIYFKKQNETGKMVTRPKFFNHTWIHWPNILPDGFIRYDIPANKNVITHLKVLDEDLGPLNLTIEEPSFISGAGTKPLITAKSIKDIQADLDRLKRKEAVADIWPKLPSKYFYLDIVTECFNRTFYRYHYGNRLDRMKCPGPDRCRLPEKPGIFCANARADYSSSTGGASINVHFARNQKFVIEDGCIP